MKRIDETGLTRLRGEAVHPHLFTAEKLREVEYALFHDGDNQKGLLAMVITANRA